MDHVVLLGAEDVRRAGAEMRSAAEDMLRAAAQIDQSLERHRQALDEWLLQLTNALTERES